MLDVKKMLTKNAQSIHDLLNMEIKETTTNEITINAGASQWISINKPTGAIAYVGYYISGINSGYINLPCARQINEGKVSFAAQNTASSQAKIVIHANWLCIPDGTA